MILMMQTPCSIKKLNSANVRVPDRQPCIRQAYKYMSIDVPVTPFASPGPPCLALIVVPRPPVSHHSPFIAIAFAFCHFPSVAAPDTDLPEAQLHRHNEFATSLT